MAKDLIPFILIYFFRTKKNKTKTQHRTLKGQSRMDNPDIQATLSKRHRTRKGKLKR
jgi:hypothetical protein